jgi:hypothetical protein
MMTRHGPKQRHQPFEISPKKMVTSYIIRNDGRIEVNAFILVTKVNVELFG